MNFLRSAFKSRFLTVVSILTPLAMMLFILGEITPLPEISAPLTLALMFLMSIRFMLPSAASSALGMSAKSVAFMFDALALTLTEGLSARPFTETEPLKFPETGTFSIFSPSSKREIFIPPVEAVTSKRGLLMFLRLTEPLAVRFPPGNEALAVLMKSVPFRNVKGISAFPKLIP